MKTLFSLTILTLNLSFALSQNFSEEFQKYMKVSDTLNQRKILVEWEKANPKDPERFTHYFNFYYAKSNKAVVGISSEPGEESLAIVDDANKTVGYLGLNKHYLEKEVEKAFQKIDQGIALHPNRLDMYLGKIYFLSELKYWEAMGQEIQKVLEVSAKNQNNWLWTHDEKLPDGKNFLLSAIQDYQSKLFMTNRDDLLPTMRTIAMEVLKHYPDHVESLSNISITYLLENEFDKGLNYLNKAEKIAPKDMVILSNMAHAYTLKKDKKKALEYYDKMIQWGTTSDIEFAREKIKELQVE